MAKKKIVKRRISRKTFFTDRRGQWIFTWLNGKIINTELIPTKRQPIRKKKKRSTSVPGQFV